MRLLQLIAMASFLLAGPAALAQQKNELDGYEEGDIEFIKDMAKLFKDKRTLEQIFKDNALSRAAEKGDMQAVRKALKAGALVNSYCLDGRAAFGSDGSGYTALMLAVWQGKVEVVRLLLEEKADVNLKCLNHGYGGETALYRAVVLNNREIMDLLIKAGARGNPKQIRPGIEMRRAACRGFQLKEGEGYPRHPGNDGGEPNTPAIAEMLKQGADINAADPKGYTPLMYAANLGLVENVRTLLAHGADATLKTSASPTSMGGVTALSLAESDSSVARKERRQIAAILKAHLAR